MYINVFDGRGLPPAASPSLTDVQHLAYGGLFFRSPRYGRPAVGGTVGGGKIKVCLNNEPEFSKRSWQIVDDIMFRCS